MILTLRSWRQVAPTPFFLIIFAEKAGMMKISFITPVYNRPDCILRCLESVARQKPQLCEIEHVVVDDGSSDNTFEVVEDFARSHPGVVAVRLPRNMGPNAARNAAIRAASGEYICLLDSSDVLLDGAPDAMAQTIMDEPEFKHFMFVSDDRSGELNSYGERKVFVFNDFLCSELVADFVHVFLRSTALALPFDEEIRIFEGIFFLRFYRLVEKVLFVNKTLVHVETGRTDRVSFTLNKTNDRAFINAARSIELSDEFFHNDYLATPRGREILGAKLTELYTFYVLLGRYGEASEARVRLEALGWKAPTPYRALHAIRLGRPACAAVKLLVKAKHRMRR